MKKFVFVIISAAFFSIAHAGGYRCEKIAKIGLTGELVIADGRNDGQNRLYIPASRFHEIYWNGASWVNDSLFYDIIGMCRCAVAGSGRNDSIIRLYTGVSGSVLWEFTYNGSQWDSIRIDDRKGSNLLTIAVGDIKNDDTIRVVAGGNDSVTIAYTFDKDSSIWLKDTLVRSSAAMTSSAIGNGRNDGINRLYLGNWYRIQELTYFSSWSFDTVVSFFIEPYGIAMGQVKNDSLNRIYISGNYECLWTGTDWDCQPIDTTYGCSGRSAIGAGRNDGVNRLYTATSLNEEIDSTYANVYIREKSYYPDSGWKAKNIPIVIVDPWWNLMREEMDYVTVGDLRNDGIQRVYGICSNGEIFECTWDDTLNGVAGTPVYRDKVYSLKLEQNYPNPFKTKTTINYQLTTNGSVNLSVYNIAGQLVKTLIDDPSPNALGEGRVRSIPWNGRDDNGRAVANGIYVYRLTSGGQSQTKKMIVIR